MKKILCFYILGVMLLSAACHPDRICCVLPQRSAEITAQKNGQIWDPMYVVGNRDVETITIAAKNLLLKLDTAIRVDSLNIKIIYTGLGNYKLSGDQVFYETYDANGAASSYKLDTSVNNALNVTAYQTLDNPATSNPNQFKITGTFNLKFLDPKNPAGISFTDGKFYTIMNQ